MNYEKDIIRDLLDDASHTLHFGQTRADTEVVITGGPPLDASQLDSMRQLQCVIRYARNRYPIDDELILCHARGIERQLFTGVSADSMAEHTLLLILSMLRRLRESMDMNAWGAKEVAERGIHDLKDISVGLIGLGKIGARVAQLLNGFGARVFYFKKNRLSTAEERTLGVAWKNLDDLLQETKIISLHTRLSPGKPPVLNREHISSIPDGTIFVNTANGTHVDQEALLERVQEGTLRVALDTFEQEPWAVPENLRRCKSSYIFTPHIGGRSRSVALDLFGRVCDAVKSLAVPVASKTSSHFKNAGDVSLRRPIAGKLAFSSLFWLSSCLPATYSLHTLSGQYSDFSYSSLS